MNPNSNDQDLHVVFGAGGAGGAIVRELAAQGKTVRAVTHSGKGSSPSGVQTVTADAADPASAKAACAGAAVVYHAVNVPYPAWSSALPPVMDSLIAAAGAADATLVYVDNAYAYGPVDRPMTEGMPDAATTKKGRLRAQLAANLLAAHKAGTVRAVIGRGSDYYGPGVTNAVAGDRVFPAVLAGKKAMWAGSLDQPHTMTYIEDFARVLITLGAHPEAHGQIWHAPAAEPLTGRQFLTLACELAGRPARVGPIRRWSSGWRDCSIPSYANCRNWPTSSRSRSSSMAAATRWHSAAPRHRTARPCRPHSIGMQAGRRN